MLEKQVIIRSAHSGDIDSIFHIESLSFSDAWSRESFVNEIEKNHMAHYYIAEVDSKVVAYIGYWQILEQAHITNVAVLIDYRGRGIARNLIKRIFDDSTLKGIETYTLECRVSNTPALNLYESLGFKSSGIRPKYYIDNGEDAVVMWLESKEIDRC